VILASSPRNQLADLGKDILDRFAGRHRVIQVDRVLQADAIARRSVSSEVKRSTLELQARSSVVPTSKAKKYRFRA
jgi:hypothetical protein